MRSLLMTVVLGSVIAAQPTTVAPTEISREVKKHLLSLPYYGPFDLITFSVDSTGVVTLGGYVVFDAIKKDAEREAREAKGVREVQNKIEVASLFPLDDEIRHRVFHAIYGDPVLSRYATPDDELWSTRPAFRGWGTGFRMGAPRMISAPFFGLEPVGTYAIHILVKARVVTLVGVVDNTADKTIAGVRARTVPDVITVNNDLEAVTTASGTKLR
jgi:osmotically-inducible protein OsmY